jgi:hypothetical protein
MVLDNNWRSQSPLIIHSPDLSSPPSVKDIETSSSTAQNSPTLRYPLALRSAARIL